MKKIERDTDSWGDTIIDVYECERYKYEYPDGQSDLCKHNFEKSE